MKISVLHAAALCFWVYFGLLIDHSQQMCPQIDEVHFQHHLCGVWAVKLLWRHSNLDQVNILQRIISLDTSLQHYSDHRCEFRKMSLIVTTGIIIINIIICLFWDEGTKTVKKIALIKVYFWKIFADNDTNSICKQSLNKVQIRIQDRRFMSEHKRLSFPWCSPKVPGYQSSNPTLCSCAHQMMQCINREAKWTMTNVKFN